MWALIIFIIYHAGYAGGAGATTVQGFTSKAKCESAGYETTVEMNNAGYRYLSNGMLGVGAYKVKADTIRGEAVRYGYRCIEVE